MRTSIQNRTIFSPQLNKIRFIFSENLAFAHLLAEQALVNGKVNKILLLTKHTLLNPFFLLGRRTTNSHSRRINSTKSTKLLSSVICQSKNPFFEIFTFCLLDSVMRHTLHQYGINAKIVLIPNQIFWLMAHVIYFVIWITYGWFPRGEWKVYRPLFYQIARLNYMTSSQRAQNVLSYIPLFTFEEAMMKTIHSHLQQYPHTNL